MYAKSRERTVEIDDGRVLVKKRALGIPTGEDTLLVDDLVDVVSEGESVFLVDGVQSVELPNLRGESTEVARQLRAHAGIDEDDVEVRA
jgi:hypothetical protein